MIIESPIPTKPITYYEITSPLGQQQSFTIDPKAGDTYQEFETYIEVVVVARPLDSDPTKKIPAQLTKVYKQHVLSILTWTVEVQEQPYNPNQS